MTSNLVKTINGIPVSDGFDFPVGKRGEDVWHNYKVDATLADPNYYKIYHAWHTGEDWNGRGGGDTDLGDPVYAAANGRVVESGYYTPSWGNLILLEHVMPNGSLVWTQYAHLDKILVKKKGQTVRRGERIGAIGKGERTPQKPRGRWIAHLHFEIRQKLLPIDNWLPLVYSRTQVLANYYSPTAFINQNRPDLFAERYNLLNRPQVIVDSQKTNKSAGTFRKARVEYWFSAPYGYQGTMLWTYAAAKTESNWAEWRPKLPTAGMWQVWVYIPTTHATTTNARYRIVYAGGRNEVAINQDDYRNEWVKLGTFPFEPGRGYVRLSDLTGERTRKRMVGFDAVRWIKVADLPQLELPSNVDIPRHQLPDVGIDQEHNIPQEPYVSA